ncbi:hypothetical protein [Siminovitchia fordii]|uniref:hypothetical protein n=1 Tax=Siminovitchia fordii TaxID=254759 RepID=UPI0003A58A4E|nr:hypothetical protein [Siminovitchia fordii]
MNNKINHFRSQVHHINGEQLLVLFVHYCLSKDKDYLKQLITTEYLISRFING